MCGNVTSLGLDERRPVSEPSPAGCPAGETLQMQVNLPDGNRTSPTAQATRFTEPT